MNPTLMVDEVGQENDTQFVKIGPGAWNSLTYFADGDFDSLAVAVATEAIRQRPGTLRSVTDFGATGDGLTDDTVAINSAISASRPGDVITFPATGAAAGGATTYLISAAIVLKPYRKYVGVHRSPGALGTTIKQKAGANIPVMFVSEAYQTNATMSGDPIAVDGLCFDGNKANQTSGGIGLLGMNYNSTFENLYFSNMFSHGLVLSDTNLAGTTISGTMSNCLIKDVYPFQCGGHGIWVKDNGSGAIVDGTLTNCYPEYSGGHGIFHQRMAGWFVNGVHSTNSALDGMRLECLRDSFINDIEVDGFGAQNTGTSVGFNVNGLMEGRHSTIDNVHVATAESTYPSTNYIYVRVQNQTTGLATRLGMTNVKLTRDFPGGASSVGLSLQSNTGTVIFIDDPTNDFRGLSTTLSAGASRHDTSNRVQDFVETMDRNQVGISGTSTSPSPGAGTLVLTFKHVEQTMNIGTLTALVMDQAQVGATLVKYGIYLIDPANGNGTCIARTASDTAMLLATNTAYPKVIADDGQGGAISSVLVLQGQIVAFALLHVGSSQNPRLAGHIGPAALAPGSSFVSRTMGFLTAQVDLPATFLGATLTANNTSGSTYYLRGTP